ncbi:MAG: DUF89 family protein [Acidimicrobiia bacterium]|nr:DUF89 family protein [Acidimicrobiia bacterium]
MRSWERDLDAHLAVLRRFVELTDLPAGERRVLVSELERYIRLRLGRAIWMEPDVTRFHTEWYREFYRIIGVTDPFLGIKADATQVATALVSRLSPRSLRSAVLASILANRLDHGAPEPCTDLDPAEAGTLASRLFVDDFAALETAVRTAGHVAYLADNAGEIVVDLVVIRRILDANPRCQVSIAAKQSPMINDVTVEEVRALQLPEGVEVCSTGSNCFGAPEDEVSVEFRQMLRRADLIVAKGHAYLEFWSRYDEPKLFNLAYTKFPVVDGSAGVIPAGVPVIIGGRRGRGARRYAYDGPVGA